MVRADKRRRSRTDKRRNRNDLTGPAARGQSSTWLWHRSLSEGKAGQCKAMKCPGIAARRSAPEKLGPAKLRIRLEKHSCGNACTRNAPEKQSPVRLRHGYARICMGNATPAQAPQRAGLAPQCARLAQKGRGSAEQSIGTGLPGKAREQQSVETLWHGEDMICTGKATPAPDMRGRSRAKPRRRSAVQRTGTE